MDEKKGIERRKFIKDVGKGLVVAAYVAPAIISFTLTDSAEAKSSGKSGGKGHGRISPHPGSGKGHRRGKGKKKGHQ